MNYYWNNKIYTNLWKYFVFQNTFTNFVNDFMNYSFILWIILQNSFMNAYELHMIIKNFLYFYIFLSYESWIKKIF